MLLIGYLLLALVVAAVLFYLVVALLPSGLTVTPIRDNRPLELPANRRMRLSDLDRIRIPVSLRGYRFAETDELIDRLAAEIQVRDEEIDRLKRHGAPFLADQPPDSAVEGDAPEPADETGPEGSAPEPADETGPERAEEPAPAAAAEPPAEPEWAVRELGDQAAGELARDRPHHAPVEPRAAVEPCAAVEPSRAAVEDEPAGDER